MPPFLNMVGHVLTARSLLAYGTPSSCSRFLPGLANGDAVWCQLFSEPGAGSDLALARPCGPRRDGDSWVLTGQKVWCSNGRVADHGDLPGLRTRSTDEAPRHKGISVLRRRPLGRPGVEVRPLRQVTGGSEFDEVFLD